MIAILPAAGLGTRMASVTNGAAKEALPLGSKSILDRVIDEAFSAGASHCVVVSSVRKPELNALVAGLKNVSVEFQEEPLGLAHAIVSSNVTGDVLVLLPDTVFSGGCAACRLSGFGGGDGGLLVEEVSEEAVSTYGIVGATKTMEVTRLIEKPKPGQTDSRLAIAARYFFGAKLMQFVTDHVNKGERELTVALQAAIKDGFGIKAVPASGLQRLDCGSPDSYFAAKKIFESETSCA